MYWYEEILHWLFIFIWPIIVILAIFILKDPINNLLKTFAGIIPKSDIEIGKYLKLSPRKGINDAKELKIEYDAIEGAKEKKSDQRAAELKWFGELLNEAQTFMDTQNNEEAIKTLKYANRIVPNHILVLHNLGVVLIRNGKIRKECYIEAENVCKNALYSSDEFPFGTLYNLARAQSIGGNFVGLRQTLLQMSKVGLPANLANALLNDPPDPDIASSDEVIAMPEFAALIEKLKSDRAIKST